MKTRYRTYPQPRFRRCEHCRHRVPLDRDMDLRCVCEMVIEQETLDAAIVDACEAPVPIVIEHEPLYEGDRPLIALAVIVMLALVIGVQFLRLQTWGEAEVRSWSPPETSTVSR